MRACWTAMRSSRKAGGRYMANVPERLLLARLLVHIDLDRTGKQRAPGLQVGLHASVAGDALAVDLDHLVGLVFDLVNEACRVVHVLQQARAAAAKGVI